MQGKFPPHYVIILAPTWLSSWKVGPGVSPTTTSKALGHWTYSGALTFTGAEAELTVFVEVGSGTAPAEVIRAPIRGARCIGLTLEYEGKVAGGAVCVSIAGGNHCRRSGESVMKLMNKEGNRG